MRGVGGDVHALVAGEKGDLKTLVSSGSRYSSAAAFAFFIQAVSVLAEAGCSSSGNVLLGVFAVICTGALPFCWSPTQPILAGESL